LSSYHRQDDQHRCVLDQLLHRLARHAVDLSWPPFVFQVGTIERRAYEMYVFSELRDRLRGRCMG